MNLYHLTAIPATSIAAVAQGSFTAAKQHELVVSTGTALEIYRLHAKKGQLQALFRQEMFGKIRSIAAFRLHATRRDYVVVTADSGCLTVLAADAAAALFRVVHCEAFGRSGCRRVVPGQWLVCEPRGRACMTAAVERTKFVYVLNRDVQDRLTLSSPLEAHKSGHATLALTALDVGFDNPVFAALERAYSPLGTAPTTLVYYELDLGLNTVVRKATAPVHASSALLVPVPGHTDGPGGVLVCSAGYVTYRNLFDDDDLGNDAQSQGADTTTDPNRPRTQDRDHDRDGGRSGTSAAKPPKPGDNAMPHANGAAAQTTPPRTARPRIEAPSPSAGEQTRLTRTSCARPRTTTAAETCSSSCCARSTATW